VGIPLPDETYQWYKLVTRPEYVGTAATKSLLQAVFDICEAWGVEVHPDARRLERRIPGPPSPPLTRLPLLIQP
jgi:hypothetical protein